MTSTTGIPLNRAPAAAQMMVRMLYRTAEEHRRRADACEAAAEAMEKVRQFPPDAEDYRPPIDVLKEAMAEIEAEEAAEATKSVKAA